MSDKKSNLPINVDIGLSAKAEFKAAASEESSSRFLDTLTDIIRPFSEARGLKGDLIRLQREEIAFQIVEMARARIENSGQTIQSRPHKFLVPFLEFCSLESDNDSIKEMWAALLANSNAETDPDSYYALNVLKEITSKEAELISIIYNNFEISRFNDYTEYNNFHKQNVDIALRAIEESSLIMKIDGGENIKKELKNNKIIISKATVQNPIRSPRARHATQFDENVEFSDYTNQLYSKDDRFYDALMHRHILRQESHGSTMSSLEKGFNVVIYTLNLTSLGFSVLKKLV